jgi:hypothetical protein
MLSIATCVNRTQYGAKDAVKAAQATKYIGRGSVRSSTNAYCLAIGPAFANTGIYNAQDVVWISAEGNRAGRIGPDFTEIEKALTAKASFITDSSQHRNRPYNLGERQVAAFLETHDYIELKPGIWSPERG